MREVEALEAIADVQTDAELVEVVTSLHFGRKQLDVLDRYDLLAGNKGLRPRVPRHITERQEALVGRATHPVHGGVHDGGALGNVDAARVDR
ncbi:hypothetical protein CPZ06_10180, partial [Lactobacillus acidophilus]